MQEVIEQFLKDEIGLSSEAVGASVIRHALKERMSALGLDDLRVYWTVLNASAAERQALVDATIVPETWFFRDEGAFAAVVQHLRTLPRSRQSFRLLSLPCSTGEEPYSMAMAMLDAGFPAEAFSIEARDVSQHNIAAAERAIYGRNSFRGRDLGFRDRHFEPVDGEYRPRRAVRDCVRFRRANLFDLDAEREGGRFDIVFCRNLLIYFDRPTQDRALDKLRSVLAPDGLLLVGPAESALPIACGFASARLPMAFAFSLKREEAGKPAAPARRAAPPPPPAPAGTARLAVVPAKPRPAAQAKPSPARGTSELPPPDRAGESLAAIERAANAGRLAQALEAARAHLSEFGASAEAFYRLGLVLDADGATDEAIQNYRKALYLAPEHREALAHLALLLQRRGDGAGAKTLNDRLARMSKRSGS
ncbi:methyltransferase [Kaistia sp. 32K]|uniref:CheR family methyltransferase n=1 Tax=Kaistia sp. 32K TaxID=2795690 RepID=UPI0019162CB9|nr:CheR family methyltransferase [Kaistia sp. 32K]BCP55750.1 methyltransferase [Kaistia sp. 32K]